MNADEQEFNKKVAYMEPRDFDEKTGKFKVDEKLVIMFMSSWCGACKNTKPAFAKITDDLKKSNIRTACIMYDGDQDDQKVAKMVAEKHNIQAFPTFLLVDASGNVKDKKKGGNTNHKQLLKTLQF